GHARKNNLDFGELVGLRIDLYAPRMLLDNNVVTDRQTKTGALSGGFCREEGIEHLFLHLGRYAHAIVTNPDLYLISETSCCYGQFRFEVIVYRLPFAFRRRIKPV